MTHHATQTLQELGYRLTPQRTLVWDVLRTEDRHLDAEEIGSLVQERFPHVNMSTVYRTLELLVDLKLVRETHLGPGRRYYEIEEGEPHHHLVCGTCGGIAHLSAADAEGLKEELAERHDFEVGEIVVLGFCRSCCGPRSTRSPDPEAGSEGG